MSGRAATVNVIPGLHALSVGRTDMPAPRGWAWFPLEEVARLESGHTPSRERPEYWDGGIPWIGIKDARAHHAGVILQTLQTVTQAGIDNSAARVLPAGTVCLSRTASVGYVVVTGREMATSQDFVNWICGPALDPHFLKYLFIAENESLHRFSKGTTHSTIYFPEVKAFHVCLPPLAEQKRIVTKLEELTSRSRRAKQELDAVPPLLDQLRQSILAAAFRGDLTADWREKNPDVEPAGDLLTRLHEEIRRRRQATEPARNRPKAARSSENSAQSNPDDDHSLPHLPLKWVWATPEEICAPVANALTIGPFGSDLKVSDYREQGVPLVFVREIRAERFGDTNTKHIDAAKAVALSRHTVLPGDLLITKMGDPPGDTAVYPMDRPPAVVTADCIKLTPLTTFTDAHFLRYACRTQAVRDQLLEQTAGVAQQKLSLERFRTVRIPCAPREEQRQIVKIVDALFDRVTAVARTVQALSASVIAFEMSALATAFRGNLVPQDPNDESVAEPLRRLQSSIDPDRSDRRARRKMRDDHEVSTSEGDDSVASARRRSSSSIQVDLPMFVELDGDALHDLVFTALWAVGPLQEEEAARRIAECARDAGIQLRPPLHTQLLAAMNSAVAANHLDRPLPNHVRAIKPDPTSYTPDDWHHIVVTTLPTTPTDRDTAIRTAAEYARDNLGLAFSRLRTDGRIVQALRSAIITAIRRGEVLRHGPTKISLAPSESAPRTRRS